MNSHLDRPPMDESGSSADGAEAKATRQWPTSMISRVPEALSAVAKARNAGDTCPMIKPSPHQKVAIDVHRQDWP